jgi:hypothetical protein
VPRDWIQFPCTDSRALPSSSAASDVGDVAISGTPAASNEHIEWNGHSGARGIDGHGAGQREEAGAANGNFPSFTPRRPHGYIFSGSDPFMFPALENFER